MPDLFNKQESQDIIDRFSKLSNSAEPLWGKMNVSQMLAHCQAPLQVALGEMNLKRGLFGFLFGKLAKKTVVSDKPFKRGLPTAPAFIVKDDRDFEKERTKLISLIEKFTETGPAVLTNKSHPFFGPMTAEEWSKSQYKHLDHHLQQFGN